MADSKVVRRSVYGPKNLPGDYPASPWDRSEDMRMFPNLYPQETMFEHRGYLGNTAIPDAFQTPADIDRGVECGAKAMLSMVSGQPVD